MENDYILVHKETIVTCCNCGFECEIGYTEEVSKEKPHERICLDCVEGDSDW